MRSFLIQIIATTILVAQDASAAEGDDVGRLRNLHQALLDARAANSFDEAAATGAAVADLQERLLARLTTEGFPEDVRNNPSLVMSIRNYVRNEISRFRSAKASDLRSATFTALTVLHSRAAEDAILADWLDLPPQAPANVAAPQPLLSKLTASNSLAGLRLDTDHAKIASDVGGEGAGNGAIDGGDWIRLIIPIVNGSTLPWVSTSGRWTAVGNCVYLPDSDIFDLAELPVGATADLALDMYLARDCGDRTISVRLELLDTHRAPTTPLAIGLDLTVRTVSFSHSKSLVFDRDVPGWSDGAKREILDAGGRIELSAGIEVSDTTLQQARQSWAWSRYATPAFEKQFLPKQLEMPRSPSQRPGYQIFGMADDLDLKAKEGEAFVEALAPTAVRLGWGNAGAAGFAVRISTSASNTSPKPPDAPWTERSVVPSLADVTRLVNDHVHIDAEHSTPPPSALDKVTGGYIANLDPSFGSAWCRMIYPDIPASEPCPRPAPEATTQEVTTYTFHQYAWVPLAWVATAPPSPTPPPPPPPPPPPTPEPTPEPPREPSAAFAHILVESGVASQRRLADTGQKQTSVEPWFGLELQFGRKAYGGVSVSYSPTSYTGADAPIGESKYTGWDIGGLGGYRWRATPWLAIPADLAVALRSTAVWDVVPWDDLPQARQYAVVATPRIGAEFYPLRWLSIDVRLGADIEVGYWTSPNGASRRVNNTGVVAGGGLGFHF